MKYRFAGIFEEEEEEVEDCYLDVRPDAHSDGYIVCLINKKGEKIANLLLFRDSVIDAKFYFTRISGLWPELPLQLIDGKVRVV